MSVYDADRAKRARYQGAAAAAAAHGSHAKHNPTTYRELIQTHFKLVVEGKLGDSEQKALELLMTFTPYAEYRTCNLPRDNDRGVHSCVTREDTVDAAAANNPSVLECGCSLVPIFPVIPQPPTNPEAVRQYASEWQRLAVEAKRTHGDFNQLTNPAARKAETDAWVRYCTVMYNTVRPHVIMCFGDQLDAFIAHPTEFEAADAVKEAGGALLPQYVQLLSEWELALHARVARTLGTADTRKKIMDLTTPTWCFKHNKVGHLSPIQGYRGYDAQCWVCPTIHTTHVRKEKPPERKVMIALGGSGAAYQNLGLDAEQNEDEEDAQVSMFE